jgi:nicotinamide riboside kinase
MKLAVIGPQNTGKSTFVQDFLAAFPEYSTPSATYRDIVRGKNLSINQLTSTDSQKYIRDFLYDQVIHADENTVLDRCVIDNYMYTLWAFKEGNTTIEFVEETKRIMIESLSYIDTYIFIPTTVAVKLVDDSLRDTTVSYVDTVNRFFIETLFELIDAYKIRVVVISGNREERIELIKHTLAL